MLGTPIGVTISAIRLEICAKTAGIKTYKSITKKKNERNDKIVLLAKAKVNSIEVSISKSLVDSDISHDEYVSINSMLKEYDDTK